MKGEAPSRREETTLDEELKNSKGSNKLQNPKSSRKEKMGDEEVNGPRKNKPNTFEFSIQDHDWLVQMKNIPISTLPIFYGISKEDPNTFLFEIDVLCHWYDYCTRSKKLKLFPTTLKYVSLHCFYGTWGKLHPYFR